MKRQNTKHPLLLILPVLTALVFGSFATTDAFAEDVLGVAPPLFFEKPLGHGL